MINNRSYSRRANARLHMTHPCMVPPHPPPRAYLCPATAILAQTCPNAHLHSLSFTRSLNMISRISILPVVFALLGKVVAEVAPEITTVTDGYNFIAKIPCVGCSYLYQDTSKGSDEPWTKRGDNSALVMPSFNDIQALLADHMPAPQHLPPLRFSISQHQQRPAINIIQSPSSGIRQPSLTRHICRRPL
jgi:hypothetical protein